VRSSRASERGDQLKEVEAQAQKILAEVHNAANLDEQYAAVTAATKELESRLMRRSERARNQGYFYELEMETGVKEISLQPGSPNARMDGTHIFDRIEFAITVQGEYRQILDFVGRLESGQHFCHVTSAALSRQEATNAAAPGSVVNLMLNVQLLGLP
jgi:hypothetical protein